MCLLCPSRLRVLRGDGGADFQAHRSGGPQLSQLAQAGDGHRLVHTGRGEERLVTANRSLSNLNLLVCLSVL